jgi:hypothetical protein
MANALPQINWFQTPLEVSCRMSYRARKQVTPTGLKTEKG